MLLVVIPGLPLADLHAWGRDPDGIWWGLCSWPGPDHMRPSFRSGWLPGHRIQRPASQTGRAPLAMIGLPSDHSLWPLLWMRDGVRVDHLGAVPDPETLEQEKKRG